MDAKTSPLAALLTNWNDIPKENVAEGIERQMVTGERITLCRLRFAPFVVTPAHSHPHEQITIVARGKVKFIINGEEKILAAGDVVHFPPNNWHGATMLDEEVELIDIFSPVREDFLK